MSFVRRALNSKQKHSVLWKHLKHLNTAFYGITSIDRIHKISADKGIFVLFLLEKNFTSGVSDSGVWNLCL